MPLPGRRDACLDEAAAAAAATAATAAALAAVNLTSGCLLLADLDALALLHLLFVSAAAAAPAVVVVEEVDVDVVVFSCCWPFATEVVVAVAEEISALSND